MFVTITESEYISKNRLVSDIASGFALTFDEDGEFVYDVFNNHVNELRTKAIHSTGGLYNNQRIFLDCYEAIVYPSTDQINIPVIGDFQIDTVCWLNSNTETNTICHKPQEYFVKIVSGYPTLGIWNGSSYTETKSDLRLNIHQFYYLVFQAGFTQKVFVNGLKTKQTANLIINTPTNNNLIIGAFEQNDTLIQPLNGGISLFKINFGVSVNESESKIKHKVRQKIGGKKQPTAIKLDYDKKQYKYAFLRFEGTANELYMADYFDPTIKKKYSTHSTLNKKGFGFNQKNGNYLMFENSGTANNAFYTGNINFYQPILSANHNYIFSTSGGNDWVDGSIDFSNNIWAIMNNDTNKGVRIISGNTIGNPQNDDLAQSVPDCKIINNGTMVLYQNNGASPQMYLADVDGLTLTNHSFLTGSVATGIVGWDYASVNYNEKKIFVRAGGQLRKGELNKSVRSVSGWTTVGSSLNPFYSIFNKYYPNELITGIYDGSNFFYGKIDLTTNTLTNLDSSTGTVNAPTAIRNIYSKTNLSAKYIWHTLLNNKSDLATELIDNSSYFLNDGWNSTQNILTTAGVDVESDSYFGDVLNLNSSGTLEFQSETVTGLADAKLAFLSIIKPTTEFYNREQVIFANATGTATNSANKIRLTVSNSGTVYCTVNANNNDDFTAIWSLSDTNIDRYQNKWFGIGLNIDLSNSLVELIVNENNYTPSSITGTITSIANLVASGGISDATGITYYIGNDGNDSGALQSDFYISRFGLIANQAVNSIYLIQETNKILYFNTNGRNISDRYNWNVVFSSDSFSVNSGTVLTNVANNTYNGSLVDSTVWTSRRIDCTTTTGTTISVGSGAIDSSLTDLSLACLFEITQTGSVSELFALNDISINLAQSDFTITVGSGVIVTGSVNLNYQEEYKLVTQIDFENQTISASLDDVELELTVTNGSLNNLSNYSVTVDLDIGTSFKGYISRFNLATNNNQYYNYD